MFSKNRFVLSIASSKSGSSCQTFFELLSRLLATALKYPRSLEFSLDITSHVEWVAIPIFIRRHLNISSMKLIVSLDEDQSLSQESRRLARSKHNLLWHYIVGDLNIPRGMLKLLLQFAHSYIKCSTHHPKHQGISVLLLKLITSRPLELT